MIPKKNLFAGALGKLQNIGGSTCFTIPHTINVPVQYQVNTNLIGDFVTCSLDGRLWGLKRSNRFTFFALKWNPDSKKLEFAASVTRINENILARGLDWIITGKVLVKVLDDSPYIETVRLFNDSSVITLKDEQTIGHCYSILPKIQQFKVLDDFLTFVSQFDDINHFRSYLTQFKDIDDLFNSIRQFDDFNVSLEFFQKFNSIKDVLTFVNNTEDIDTLLNFFKTDENIDNFSTLISEFQIIENFLVRRDNNGNMLSRLVPVEFFQTRVLLNNSIFDNDLSFSCSDHHIIAHNGRLWGAGKYALGKVFLLPAIFDNTGKATTFYLYFQHEHHLPRSPQFLRLLVNDLSNLTITTFEGHSFALIKKYKSWDDAQYDCIKRGGHLATATSKAKNDFLVNLAGNSVRIWLGGKSEYPHNNWKWVTGEEWSYENWDNGISNSDTYSKYIAHYMLLAYEFDGWVFDCAYVYYSTESSEFNIVEFNVKTAYYICEWDSLDVYDTWLNHMNDEPDSYYLAPAFLDDNVHGYKFNSGHNLCSLSDDNFLLNPVSAEWAALSEHNGNIHFDINQSKAILLDDKGAYLLGDNNVRFDCNTINQWLAPANSIDALDDNLIAASDDNLTLVTHPDSNFMREALHNKVLPLSSPIGNGYRFSLGYSTNNNRKIIDVNMIESNAHNPQPVLWNNIYRQALDLELVNVVRDVPFGGVGSIAAFDNPDIIVGSDERVRGMTTPFTTHKIVFKVLANYLKEGHSSSSVLTSSLSYPTTSNIYPSIVTEVSADVYYIDPANGDVHFFDSIQATFNEPDDYEFYHITEPNAYYVKKTTFPKFVCIVQGKIGFAGTIYHLNKPSFVYDGIENKYTETFFLPIKDIPDNLLAWCIPNRTGIHYSSGKQEIVLDKIENSYAQFHETSTNLNFALSCPDAPDINAEVASFACQEPHINLDSIFECDKKKFTHSIHIAGVFKSEHVVWVDNKGHIALEVVYDAEGNVTRSNDEVDWDAVSYNYVYLVYDLYVFRSTLHNDVFNFDSELKRSYLS